MSEQKAFFTPSAETANDLARQLLFGAKDSVPEVDFSVVAGDHMEPGNWQEVSISPVQRVCATETGYEITGLSKTTGALARLCVDTTVEPPIAIYFEAQTA